MRAVTIRIQGLAEAGVPLFPELAADPPPDLDLKYVGILEGGMESGDPSLFLVAERDGQQFSVQISYGQWDAITGALRGAMARWADA